MESIDNELNKPKVKRKYNRSPDRISVSESALPKLEMLLEQVNLSSRGFLTLTKSDLVNYLIESHKDELSTKELSQIKASFYDPIKHVTWLAQQIKTALVSKDYARVNELQTELRKIELVAKQSALNKQDGFNEQSNERMRSKLRSKTLQRKLRKMDAENEVRSALSEDSSLSKIDFQEK